MNNQKIPYTVILLEKINLYSITIISPTSSKQKKYLIKKDKIDENSLINSLKKGMNNIFDENYIVKLQQELLKNEEKV